MDDAEYPVQFAVEYPDRDLNRTTTFFRVFAAIPILILMGALTNGSFRGSWGGTATTTSASAGGIGLLVAAPLLMIVFRQKYPRWWFDWNRELLRFWNRVCVYLLLMDDRYPSTDELQSVQLEFEYPNAADDLNRWLPLVKWLLAFPHYVVLFVLGIAAFACVVVAWFAILFTGRYPRGLFDFVCGVLRWENRVAAYAFALVTDEYPPFRLAP